MPNTKTQVVNPTTTITIKAADVWRLKRLMVDWQCKSFAEAVKRLLDERPAAKK